MVKLRARPSIKARKIWQQERSVRTNDVTNYEHGGQYMVSVGNLPLLGTRIWSITL